MLSSDDEQSASGLYVGCGAEYVVAGDGDGSGELDEVVLLLYVMSVYALACVAKGHSAYPPVISPYVDSVGCWPECRFLPPTAPPTAAPTMTSIITVATTKNVFTFMPNIMRGGLLFSLFV